jgi:nicotinamide-nucleotide amidase
MKAEIISVGTEILLGEILDTNSQYLAVRLPPLGIDLYYMSKVGDNLQRLAETIGRARERSDLVLVTGGLGPTEDDLTREAIALSLGEEMYVDAETEQRLRAFFAARGYNFPESNGPSPTPAAPPPAGGWRRTAASSWPCPAPPPSCNGCGRWKWPLAWPG